VSIKDELDRTRSRIANHQQAIQTLQAHGRAVALKSLGIEKGERIIVIIRNKDVEAEVTGVDGWDYSPRPRVSMIRKDGTLGERSPGYFSEWRKK
jgi:hypothetical protein